MQRLLAKPPLAAMAYFVVMSLSLFEIGSALVDVLGRRADVAASAAMLEQFDGRRASAASGQGAALGGPSGSPFLQGATVTVAGAVLLQRVTGAVTKFGGSVLSSQVDLNGAQSKAGFLTIIASCEIDQPGLQQLLYDIEAGMPFLFIDQLAVQATGGFGSSSDSKLRILLTVSGQWRGAT
ncbi:type II secretion system protein GspM [Bradyrhizobium sp.]|uniref:type II secretion system protein GspM n=1 Tax=Bradyrhizobium sp. TaxID=376 RepID=UPI003C6FF57D